MESREALLDYLEETCPLVSYTAAGRLFSTVRRMKMEQDLAVPIARRTAFVVSVKAGKPANELDEGGWDELYRAHCARLERQYPELHAQLFTNES